MHKPDTLEHLINFLNDSRPNHAQMLAALGEHPWEQETFVRVARRNGWEIREILKNTTGAQYLMHIYSIKRCCELSRLAVSKCIEYNQTLAEANEDSTDVFLSLAKELEILFTKEMYSFLLITISAIQYADKFLKKKNASKSQVVLKKYLSLLNSTKNIRNSIAHHGFTPARWFVKKDFVKGTTDCGFRFTDDEFLFADFKIFTFQEIVKAGSVLQFIIESQSHLDLFCDEYTNAIFEELAEPIKLADKYCFWSVWGENGTDAIFKEKSGSNYTYLKKVLNLS